MNRIKKFYKTVSLKEKMIVDETVDRVLEGNFTGLNIKKLVGLKFFYRVRKSRFRIIFYHKGSDIRLVDIDRRDDNTYKQF